MYSTEILSNTATIREANATEIDSYFYLKLFRERYRITRHYNAELQTAKQTLTTSKNLRRIEINLRRLVVYGSVKRAKD